MIICHRTGSATNPYVVINVSIRAWEHGHQTHPALDGRVDHLLRDPATPGEKLPVSDCPGATSHPVETPTVVPTATIVVDATSPSGSVPSTSLVGAPLVIVVHTTPNATVTVQGAGVLGATKTVSNGKGVARISVTPGSRACSA